MDRDYYLILGVPLDAAPERIREAFRKLALRYHPDRGEEADPRVFREVSEAYEVLCDPARRARYDRQRHPREARPRPVRVEPMRSNPLPITGEPEAVRPSFEALLDRIWSNFNATGSKAEQAQPLNFELILSPEEARRGIVVPFEVPALMVCHHCGGAGRSMMLHACRFCDGEGRLVDRRTIEISVPPGVCDGTWISVSLEPLGVENLWLRVHVRVSAH